MQVDAFVFQGSPQPLDEEIFEYGVTAATNCGDRKALRPVCSNIADQIRIGELIATGHLVPPRTFVIDVGEQEEVGQVRKSVDDFDMEAGDRQTVVFCSTEDHARKVAAAFAATGVPSGLVHDDMGAGERRATLARPRA